MGVVLEKQGRFEEAAESLRTYLALKPNARDAKTVSRTIDDLDAQARRSLDREVVSDILVGLDDRAVWQYAYGIPDAERFIPIFRRTPNGMIAIVEVDRQSSTKKPIVVALDEGTRAFWVKYVIRNNAPPEPGYSCGGKDRCDFEVKTTITVESPGLVRIKLELAANYDERNLPYGDWEYVYFRR